MKLSYGSETSDMTFEGFWEMFEGGSAETCADKFPLVLMGGRVEGLACTDPGARTPIGASGNYKTFCRITNMINTTPLYFEWCPTYQNSISKDTLNPTSYSIGLPNLSTMDKTIHMKLSLQWFVVVDNTPCVIEKPGSLHKAKIVIKSNLIITNSKHDNNKLHCLLSQGEGYRVLDTPLLLGILSGVCYTVQCITNV